ncbi:hypothetical protein ACH9L7_17770 (plasmid) [Haloferax sp. S1W]|uniref:DUF7289 family protein n=1 Tax=Haloferax sp. S1W TaxID=3377110 RepID=UPI0037C8B247
MPDRRISGWWNRRWISGWWNRRWISGWWNRPQTTTEREARAVSEVVSFVLVFALVISTVAFVYALGYPALVTVQDAERVNNAERAMTTLADTVSEVTVRGAPSRATEIKLSESSLSFGPPMTVNVSDENGTLLAQSTFRPVVYESAEGTRVSYAAGGVFREQSDGVVVVRDPDLVVSGSETVILVPETTPATKTDAIVGQTGVLVRLERGNTTTVTTDGNVTVEVTSSHPDTWYEYLDSQAGATCSPPTGETVTCTFDANRASVTVVDVAVELE